MRMCGLRAHCMAKRTTSFSKRWRLGLKIADTEIAHSCWQLLCWQQLFRHQPGGLPPCSS